MEQPREFGQNHSPQRRHTARDLVEYDSFIDRERSRAIPVRIVDLSARGFHARCAGPAYERGELISVALPLVGVVPAKVMWGLRGCFGAQFNLPIDARTYLDVLAAARAGTRDARLG